MDDSKALQLILTRLDTLQSDMCELKTRTTKIEITQENDVKGKLDALLDGHAALDEQTRVLPQMQKDIESLKEDMFAVKETVTGHSAQLKVIK